MLFLRESISATAESTIAHNKARIQKSRGSKTRFDEGPQLAYVRTL